MYLGEVSILTDDVPRLAAFYRNLLGLENATGDEERQWITTEETYLSVFKKGQRNGNGRPICLAFTVEDVYTEHERLKKMGVQILEPPITRPWGAVNMSFLDPDGNAVYLRSFLKTAENGVRPAALIDLDWLAANDRHIARNDLEQCLRQGRVLIAEAEGEPVGWLRWNLFWDNTPFMNLLFLREDHRGLGLGKALATCWEEDMAARGHKRVMTSTQANEIAQHFYRKLGYRDAGALLLPGEPTELLLLKELS